MGDRLRIALITHYPQDPTKIDGGIQAASARLVAELRHIAGLEIHVLHCHSDVDESRTIVDGPLTIHFLAQTRRRLIPNMLTKVERLAHLLRRLAPDVVHAHGPNLAVAALRAGYQPIWTIHGVVRQEATLYHGLFSRLNFALARHYEQQALAKVTRVTTVSPYVVEAYSRWGNAHWASRPADWRIIDNPAPPDNFQLPRRPIAGRVFMPASVIPLKDPLTLVRAAALLRQRMPQLSVHIAGSLADCAYAEQVRREIDRAGLAEVVRLLGPLDTYALRAELVAAAVVALPSRQEVAPMAVIEAMAAGEPVVASATGGLPYLIEDRRTGYLAPAGDSAAFAVALGELLEDAELAQQIGAAARASALDRFRPARVAASYLALYRSTWRPDG